MTKASKGAAPERTPAAPPQDAAGLAALIAGTPTPPEWLVPGLRQAVSALIFALQDDDRHPNRVPLLRRLQTLLAAADFVATALRDKTTIAAMERVRSEAFDAARAVVLSLRALEALDALRPFVLVAIEAIPAGQGKHKYYPRELISPLLMCAGFIWVAWREARGKSPAYTSPLAHAACEGLWRLAGGGKRPQSSADPSNMKAWREHLGACRTKLVPPDDAPYKRLLLVPEMGHTDESSRPGLRVLRRN